MDFKNPQLLYSIIPLAIILFFIIKHDFIRFKDYREQQAFNKGKKWKRMFLYTSRLAALSLLIMALAQPFELRQEAIQGKPELNIFVDKSASMEIFDNKTAAQLASKLSSSIPVNVRTLAEGNRSAIGDAILANIQGDDSVLLITDGNSNYGRSLGDMMLFASSLNTTISAVKLSPEKKDAYVTVEGPSETTADAENTFEVTVRQTGTIVPYKLRVIVDNELAIDQPVSGSIKLEFTKSLAEGYHRITADISSEDYFPQNNHFIKTVKVQPKPKVLLVTEKNSPAAQIFTSIYDVKTASALPEDIEGYAAVIINDIKAEKLPLDTLSNYVLEGNGLFVIGGKNSFDRDSYKSPYYKSYEALLPVVVGTGKEEPKKEVNVVLLIDVSGSTGSTFNKASRYSVKDVEKALALSILNDLKKTDNVGVIAFESVPHKVSDIAKLSDNPDLGEKIERITYGRGTDIASGISAATDMLSSAHGSKNIILISDGIAGGPQADDIRAAGVAASTGAKVYAVGVGERTDTQHMLDIANAGKGAYFEPKETEKIKIVLGESEKANDTYGLEAVNNYHFITRNVKLKASVTGYNFVIPKSQAQLLVTTANNVPILTTWRFGLGRIAALSTDDGSAWNGQMLGRQNSILLSRTANWVIGDLSRNKDFDVDMDDIYLGEELEIRVISRKPPAAPNLNFSKEGEKLYTASYTPKEAGFYSFFDAITAVNHDKELSRTGMNPSLSELVAITNGDMFAPDDVQGIINKVKQDSRRVKTDSKSYSWAFALAALCIFLFEIAVRRIMETKRINKQLR
ncbi:VWA domain-containing protein [Candidatus Woesearchaeota archaeon]|nr:VWA domain-containing protein [Candidatus Woesearchaeota archaeon]